jgi:hypothetical protein
MLVEQLDEGPVLFFSELFLYCALDCIMKKSNISVAGSQQPRETICGAIPDGSLFPCTILASLSIIGGVIESQQPYLVSIKEGCFFRNWIRFDVSPSFEVKNFKLNKPQYIIGIVNPAIDHFKKQIRQHLDLMLVPQVFPLALNGEDNVS